MIFLSPRLIGHFVSSVALLGFITATPAASAAAPATQPSNVATPSGMLSSDKPVEISSDTLEVQQDIQQAIFRGNVIAVQGDVTMRADTMVVHYRQNSANTGTPSPAASDETKGIKKINAAGNVIFSNPTDTAKGDAGVYDVDKQTLDLTGTVLLTRDKNILKGTHMHYDIATGRSVLTAGNQPVTGARGNGRVHGLFSPQKSPPTTTRAAPTTATHSETP